MLRMCQELSQEQEEEMKKLVVKASKENDILRICQELSQEQEELKKLVVKASNSRVL
jgi:beta-galactosidase beta subunit